MEPKPFWQSKTFWVNLIAVAAMVIQSQYRFVVSAEDQLGVLAVINLALRFITGAPITLR